MPAIESKHVTTGSEPVLIAYIGRKAEKKDTICRTGVTWFGQFDVQAVDPVPASRLLKFPTVFIRASQLEEYKKEIVQVLEGEALAEAAEAAETKKAEEQDKLASESEEALKEKNPAEDEAKAKVIAEIQTVIQSLDSENADHFTTKGKPKVEAVRARLPELEFTADDVALAYKGLEVG